MLAPVGSLHEEHFVRAFFQKNCQERCLFLLSHPKRRRSFTDELAHFGWLDEQFARAILPSVAHTDLELVALLRRKGAHSKIWVISEDRSLDGQAFPVEEAVSKIRGSGMGAILSCVPGKLAFFSGEEAKSERLLERS